MRSVTQLSALCNGAVNATVVLNHGIIPNGEDRRRNKTHQRLSPDIGLGQAWVLHSFSFQLLPRGCFWLDTFQRKRNLSNHFIISNQKVFIPQSSFPLIMPSRLPEAIPGLRRMLPAKDGWATADLEHRFVITNNKKNLRTKRRCPRHLK